MVEIIDIPEPEDPREVKAKKRRASKARKADRLAEAQRGNIIASSARKAIDRLTPRKRNYVAARAAGKSLKEASAEVGVTHPTARKMEKEADVQAAYRELVRKAIPAKKLVRLIEGGATATMPVYGADGKRKKDRPDWKTRRPYIEMAAEHGGYHETKSEDNSKMISVIVQHIGQPPQQTGVVVKGN